MKISPQQLDIERITTKDHDFVKDENDFNEKPKKFISIVPLKYQLDTQTTSLDLVLDGIMFTEGILGREFGTKTSSSIGITLGKASVEAVEMNIVEYLDRWRGTQDLRNKGISLLSSILYCKVKMDGDQYACTHNSNPLGKNTLAEFVNSRIVITATVQMYVNWRDRIVGATILVEDINTNV